MLKALLMSVLAATLIIPINISRDRNAKRGVKRTVYAMVAFIIVWGACVSRYYYQLLPPEPPEEPGQY